MSSAVLRPSSSRRKSDQRLPLEAARQLVQTIVESWRRGVPADAGSALGSHPQLREFHSLVVELAYEEYCCRVERGEDLDAGSFCRRFPECEHSLWRQLAIDELLDFPPDLHAEVAWPLVGDEFHGYTIIEELGRGTFSRVFLAAEKSLGGRLVAIKVCPQGAEEAETLGKLRHPHIVEVLSVRTLGSGVLTVICMPYVGRTTLAHVLAARQRGELRTAAQLRDMIRRLDGPRAPVRVEDAQGSGNRVAGQRWLRGSYQDAILQIAAALARALAYAHERGVVHLDLKPSNVLLCGDGAPRLLDFNLCFDVHRWQPRLGGTLPYMSPEQVQAVYEGAGSTLDGGSDLFSLAVILCELLTGQSPFGELPESGSPLKRAKQVQDLHERGPRNMSARSLGVSRRCAGMLRRCLSERTLDRPTAAEVVAVLVREASGVGRWRRWIWGYRHWVLVGVLLSLSALAPGLWHLATRPPYAERQRNRAVVCLAEDRPAEAIRYLNRALESDPLDYEALFLRGRAFAAQQDYPSAIRDLKQVVEGTQDPKAMVYLGYACNLFGAHRDACHWYRLSISLGHTSPSILNNLAYSEFRRGNSLRAQEFVEMAIQMDPQLRPARYNRALIDHQIALDAMTLPEKALADMSWLLANSVTCNRMLNDAARIYSFSASLDARWTSNAIIAIERAVESGTGLEQLMQDTFVRKIALGHPHLTKDAVPRSYYVNDSADLLIAPESICY